MQIKMPLYEELKSIKEYHKFILYSPIVGGYFRLVINEDNQKNVSLDYLDGVYLKSISINFDSEYQLNRLYKMTKKNYEGLVKLYSQIIEMMYTDILEYIWEYEV